MKTIELSEVPALASYVQPASSEPVVLTQDGRAVAAVIPGDQQEVENLFLEHKPSISGDSECPQCRLESEGGLSSAEVRQRARAARSQGIAGKGDGTVCSRPHEAS